MGLTFLIILTIAEITLITLTFTKYSEKAAWLKNRTLVTAVETIILLAVVLLPVTHMKWRFALALVILIVRLLFELIRFAVRRKKVSGLKHKAAAVASGVLSLARAAARLPLGGRAGRRCLRADVHADAGTADRLLALAD
ncbi:MAG: hypothetical protein II685_01240, partial [Clostridia bacterium]|nr:hypothetical protein [Clostridia bacterium]